MTMSLISEYVKGRRERKLQKTRTILNRLANYYDIKRMPEIRYDQARQAIENAQRNLGSENSSKVLRNLDRTLSDDEYVNSYAFRDGRNLKSEDNPKRLRIRRSSSLLERWTIKVQPLLEEILTENPGAMDGFEVETYEPFSNIAYSSGLANNKIVFENGRFGISVKDSDEPKYSKPFFYETYQIPSTLALNVLESLEPRGGWDVFSLRWDDEFENIKTTRSLDHRRTYLIREVERRTGRNLKKEVSKIKN